jgi:hypothetical protein
MPPDELTEHQAARAAFGIACEKAGVLTEADEQTRQEMDRLEQGAMIVESPPAPVVEVEPLPESEMSDEEFEYRAGDKPSRRSSR